MDVKKRRYRVSELLDSGKVIYEFFVPHVIEKCLIVEMEDNSHHIIFMHGSAARIGEIEEISSVLKIYENLVNEMHLAIETYHRAEGEVH